MKFTTIQLALIIKPALEIAADAYQKDASSWEHEPRIAAIFRRHAKDATALLHEIENSM